MLIETERLILRPYEPDDAQALFEAKRDSLKELRVWMDWAQHEPTHEREQETIRLFQEWAAAKKELPLAIFLKDTGAFIGSGGFRYKNSDVPSFELGYWLHSSHTGQGFRTEAVKAQTEALFNDSMANRVMVRCHHLNAASARVANACGFEWEGRQRNARRHVDGQLADDLIFGHTPETWAAFKAGELSPYL